MGFGSGEAGTDRGHPNARAAELVVETFGEAVDEGLAGAVANRARRRVERHARRYVDDVAVAARDHGSQSRVGKSLEGERVQESLSGEMVAVPVEETAQTQLAPCVVHEQVDGLTVVFESLLDLPNLGE